MQLSKLAVHPDDANILLKEKNILDPEVIEKYTTAGSITQTVLKYIIQLINDSHHLIKTEKPYTVAEICLLGDSMMAKLLEGCYTDKDKVREKGIAHPVTLEVNEYVSNVSPEINSVPQTTFQAGDIVTISLGAHIDGYTALASHTLVIYPPGVMIDNELKPEGPLLGSKADAIVASNLATRAVLALLGLVVHPEMIAWIPELQNQSNAITGSIIRQIVDEIARSFNCVVVPGSKVRRVRRFLSGQAEGVVAEREFKGVVWDESNQEEDLFKKGNSSDLVVHDGRPAASTNVSSAIPTDDFVVEAGEVYNIDLIFCSVTEFEEKGLVTLETVEEPNSTIYIRDIAVTHGLKLNSAKQLLSFVDENCSVYPFKLSHTCASFPIKIAQGNIAEQIASIKSEIVSRKLGSNELANRYLTRIKPVQIAKHVPFAKILLSSNPTGKRGIDASKLTLPGKELPLPALGVSALKLKTLLKHGSVAPSTARESTTVLLNNVNKELVRLTGGKTTRPSWVHSKYEVNDQIAGLWASFSRLLDETEDFEKMQLD
ncbi:hypothetical protein METBISCDRAFT_30360 [Metschnikowia bicuspidata]|uniref:Probable metalloprotease ARX1 n=1 Tax=Metschnikowia bicuspidata TaxID=27322 RepID=A0A4P9ZGB4_9ASCO|nr:hypothetical protein METBISCDRAFT_30360 [Metschnikowia bicuspidata]